MPHTPPGIVWTMGDPPPSASPASPLIASAPGVMSPYPYQGYELSAFCSGGESWYWSITEQSTTNAGRGLGLHPEKPSASDPPTAIVTMPFTHQGLSD